MDIAELKAGHTLDALVAELVMGYIILGEQTCVYVEGEWSVHFDSDPTGWACFAEKRSVRVGDTCHCANDQKNPEYAGFRWWAGHHESCVQAVIKYSTDIAAAWQVVETFRRGANGKAACCVELFVTDYPQPQDCRCSIYGPDTADAVAWANEMPFAICLAALKAVG